MSVLVLVQYEHVRLPMHSVKCSKMAESRAFHWECYHPLYLFLHSSEMECDNRRVIRTIKVQDL